MSVPFQVNLNGKVALVTGGGGVLCSTMAKALAECGATVAVADLRLEAAQKVANEIQAAGGKAMPVACNVLERASLDAANARLRLIAPVIKDHGVDYERGKFQEKLDEGALTLERTEATAREQLQRTHGASRSLRPAEET